MIPVILLPVADSSEQQESKPDAVDLWKETNVTIRHWEAQIFENSKNLFTAITFAIGAAGAVVAWATVPLKTQRIVVSLFLSAAIAISLAAVALILSTQHYLKRFYQRRRFFEKQFGQDETDVAHSKPVGLYSSSLRRKSGWTIPALTSCFVLTMLLCGVFLKVVWSYQPERSMLSGARLQGADLSAVSGLTQRDLVDACGDANTKLPVGLVVPYCEPVNR